MVQITKADIIDYLEEMNLSSQCFRSLRGQIRSGNFRPVLNFLYNMNSIKSYVESNGKFFLQAYNEDAIDVTYCF